MIVIQIGNSDNKLSQSEWAHYVEAVRQAVCEHAQYVHFFGGSATFDPWQNVCWVADVLNGQQDALEAKLTKIRTAFRQDSIAVIHGGTVFI